MPAGVRVKNPRRNLFKGIAGYAGRMPSTFSYEHPLRFYGKRERDGRKR